MLTKKLCLLATALLILVGCQTGPSAQDQAGTMVALTAAAIPAGPPPRTTTSYSPNTGVSRAGSVRNDCIGTTGTGDRGRCPGTST